jgi:hypothetical protein
MPIPLPPSGPGCQPGLDVLPRVASADIGDRRALVSAMAAMAAMAAPSGTAAAPGLPGTGLAAGALLRFKSLMNAEGLACHLARLCADRLYAYERIAAAHATANEPLRRLALELFQIYHRCDDEAPAASGPASQADLVVRDRADAIVPERAARRAAS